MSEQQWQQDRQSYIGGSEVFELLNLPQYGKGCARALGYRKLGVEPDYATDSGTEELFKRGHVLEPLVATLYEQQTGRIVRRPPLDAEGFPKPIRHPLHKWAAVNTDRIILAGHGGVSVTGDLEIKTRSEGAWWNIKRNGPQTGDLLQTQWSNWITGHPWGALVELGVFGGLPLIHFDANCDTQLHEIFKREGEKFAESVWGKGAPPEPTIPATDQRCKVCQYRLTCRGEEIDRVEASIVYDVEHGKKPLVQIESAELSTTLHDIDLMTAERKALDESLEVAKQKAMEIMDGLERVFVHGYGKAYLIPSQYNGLDFQRLKQDHPEIYAEYSVHKLTGEHHLRNYPTMP